MVKRIKIRASVGRQVLGANTPATGARYVSSIRAQMKKITDNYEKVVEEIGKVSADVLFEALEPTFALSQKYVPKDTGKLKASGFLKIDKVSKFPRVVIGYGKAGDPIYAGIVHERLDLSHTAPTRAKYLLSALEEEESNIQSRVIIGYKRLTGDA